MSQHTLEHRLIETTVAGVELRANTDGTVAFHGYATVYDVWYDVAGGPERGGWREMVAAGAATRTLKAKPDVRLLLNHEGLPLARTRSRTLVLDEDARGLLVSAPSLDLGNPRVQELRSCMDRGDVDEMSFAFRATRSEWNDDYTERIIREFALDVVGSDVSVVTYPANPYTVAQLRSAAGIDELRASTRLSTGMDTATARAILDQIRMASTR